MKFWYAILAAFAIMTMTAPARADTFDLVAGECQTAPGAEYCSVLVNLTMLPAGTGTAKNHLYMSTDGGPWVQLLCIQRPAFEPSTMSIEVNVIGRQHRHRFRRHVGANCNVVTPTTGGIQYATGVDQSLSELANPSANPEDWARVWRQATPSSPKEFLRDCTTMTDPKGTGEWVYTAKVCWSTSEEGSQQYTRHTAHMLAKMGFDANAAGAAYGGAYMASLYSTWAVYAGAPNPACVIRQSTGTNTWSYWFNAFDKNADAWMWTSGFAGWTGPDTPEHVFCGHELQPAAQMLYHLKAEATNNVPGRNYGVREVVTGDRPIQ
jgi:hypothetical protein